MRTRKLRKPAAVAVSLALVFAMSACDTDPDDTDGTTGTIDPGLGSTTTFVDDATTTTIADAATTTTAAG